MFYTLFWTYVGLNMSKITVLSISIYPYIAIRLYIVYSTVLSKMGILIIPIVHILGCGICPKWRYVQIDHFGMSKMSILGCPKCPFFDYFLPPIWSVYLWLTSIGTASTPGDSAIYRGLAYIPLRGPSGDYPGGQIGV